MGWMIRFALALLLTLHLPRPQQVRPTETVQSRQAYTIAYSLRMPRPASHLFEVTIDVTVPQTESAGFIHFQMPRWQPGRYSVADFAKNVQEFSAHARN